MAHTYYKYKEEDQSNWTQVELYYRDDSDYPGKWGEYSWFHPVQVLANGTYDIKLVAIDLVGNVRESQVYRIRVAREPGP